MDDGRYVPTPRRTPLSQHLLNLNDALHELELVADLARHELSEGRWDTAIKNVRGEVQTKAMLVQEMAGALNEALEENR
jgi:hypothetical protein